MSEKGDWLGMSRKIQRRDFLQGVAVGAAGMVVGCRGNGSRGGSSGDAFQGGRIAGQDNPSMALGHEILSAADAGRIATAADTGESYDLVVIGAGLSGLAAAWHYKKTRGDNARILLLDNNDDFGGHARRNTFWFGGKPLIVHGGTYVLEEPEGNTYEVEQLLASVGLDWRGLADFRDESVWETYGLSSGVFYDPRVYPDAGNGQWGTRFGEASYEDFFAAAPMSASDRADLVKLYTTTDNYLQGSSDLFGDLKAMTYEQYLRTHMGLGDEAVRFCNMYSLDLIGLGVDAVSAYAGSLVGPGFAGIGRPFRADYEGDLPPTVQWKYRYPDGLHTAARHFVKALIPSALSSDASPEGLFNARVQRDALDSPQHDVRLRLGACALQVAHATDNPDEVHVTYVTQDGGLSKVRCSGAVVTWGSAAKRIVPELADEQRETLARYRYTAVLYINVLLRNWRVFADMGILGGWWPGGYAAWSEISDPMTVGAYRPTYHPDEPTVLTLYKYLSTPGLSPSEQVVAARSELLAKSFEDFEREIRSELHVMLGPWGFDPKESILGITINRWAHGYNFFQAPDDSPIWGAGRKAVGRISFAGADAGGWAWAQSAWGQAIRAATEQLALL